ncbi:hypothetical protein FOMPIDRAFT_1063618 [Fomitopsis schrenkii]|uniref:Uncharacterized protein n=1 Tax=Fomitopsis schrenkii TaxID=2126942 RepID=S8DI78_FOMSC|nr:hypothetical protein FOMPIDRAFT_1063618 [Fomitopsis schrenkii]
MPGEAVGTSHTGEPMRKAAAVCEVVKPRDRTFRSWVEVLAPRATIAGRETHQKLCGSLGGSRPSWDLIRLY